MKTQIIPSKFHLSVAAISFIYFLYVSFYFLISFKNIANLPSIGLVFFLISYIFIVILFLYSLSLFVISLRKKHLPNFLSIITLILVAVTPYLQYGINAYFLLMLGIGDYYIINDILISLLLTLFIVGLIKFLNSSGLKNYIKGTTISLSLLFILIPALFSFLLLDEKIYLTLDNQFLIVGSVDVFKILYLVFIFLFPLNISSFFKTRRNRFFAFGLTFAVNFIFVGLNYYHLALKALRYESNVFLIIEIISGIYFLATILTSYRLAYLNQVIKEEDISNNNKININYLLPFLMLFISVCFLILSPVMVRDYPNILFYYSWNAFSANLNVPALIKALIVYQFIFLFIDTLLLFLTIFISRFKHYFLFALEILTLPLVISPFLLPLYELKIEYFPFILSALMVGVLFLTNILVFLKMNKIFRWLAIIVMVLAFVPHTLLMLYGFYYLPEFCNNYFHATLAIFPLFFSSFICCWLFKNSKFKTILSLLSIFFGIVIAASVFFGYFSLAFGVVEIISIFILVSLGLIVVGILSYFALNNLNQNQNISLAIKD